MLFFPIMIISSASDFNECIQDITYVGKDIVNTVNALENKEYSVAIHYGMDGLREFEDCVKPCNIEGLDTMIQTLCHNFDITEPEWLEELFQLWESIPSDSIFDFLNKIKPIVQNNKLKEIISIILNYEYCIEDIESIVYLIYEIVNDYKKKEIIQFMKNTKALIRNITLTIMDCKNTQYSESLYITQE